MYSIAVDAMGGDFAPIEVVEGAIAAATKYIDTKITLVGLEDKLAPLIEGVESRVKERLAIRNATETITNDESPVLAIRRKVDSSLVKAFGMVKDGEAQGLVSAGSTGAVMAGSMFRLGRVNGVERPAIAVPIPTLDKPCLLLDAGANADCRPDTLLQFAIMGDIFARVVMGRENPRVSLVNIGEEEEKGSELTKAAHSLFAANKDKFNFIGNVEGRGIPLGDTDVAVCDGFTGNVILKTMEGLTKALLTRIKKELTSSIPGTIGGFLAKGAFASIKRDLSPEEVGGSLMIGAAGVVVKAHGNSKAAAFAAAIGQARTAIKGDVIVKITQAMGERR